MIICVTPKVALHGLDRVRLKLISEEVENVDDARSGSDTPLGRSNDTAPGGFWKALLPEREFVVHTEEPVRLHVLVFIGQCKSEQSEWSRDILLKRNTRDFWQELLSLVSTTLIDEATDLTETIASISKALCIGLSNTRILIPIKTELDVATQLLDGDTIHVRLKRGIRMAPEPSSEASSENKSHKESKKLKQS